MKAKTVARGHKKAESPSKAAVRLINEEIAAKYATSQRRMMTATIASGLVGAPYMDQQDAGKVATVAIAIADQIIAQTDPSYVAPVPVPPLGEKGENHGLFGSGFSVVFMDPNKPDPNKPDPNRPDPNK